MHRSPRGISIDWGLRVELLQWFQFIPTTNFQGELGHGPHLRGAARHGQWTSLVCSPSGDSDDGWGSASAALELQTLSLRTTIGSTKPPCKCCLARCMCCPSLTPGPSTRKWKCRKQVCSCARDEASFQGFSVNITALLYCFRLATTVTDLPVRMNTSMVKVKALAA